ncbi:MAG TPA: hypothetical protein VIY86_11075 [Pirellulaceae bacterium]
MSSQLPVGRIPRGKGIGSFQRVAVAAREGHEIAVSLAVSLVYRPPSVRERLQAHTAGRTVLNLAGPHVLGVIKQDFTRIVGKGSKIAVVLKPERPDVGTYLSGSSRAQDPP